MMEVRDALHGLIEFDEKEESIINTNIVQRLRGIKQLALASLVYPGAHHTRFEHSLGVMHLSGKVGKLLDLEKENRKILRYAGLLHDIGHGPFSHVLEQIIDKGVDKGTLKKYDADNAHELMSILFVKRDDELAGILTEDERENVVKLLQKQKIRSIDKGIVSGPLDVDKLDYLQRDSYFAGVKYGTFDIEKVIESLTPIKLSRVEETLGIREEGVYAVEQLLLAKYHMNIQVYRHRVRRITDAMIVRGVEFAIRERIKKIIELSNFKDDKSYLEIYSTFDDHALINTILRESTDISKIYFKRIIERKLFKEIFNINIDTKNFDDSMLLEKARNISDDEIKNISNEISDILNISEEEIIFDKQTITNPTFKDVRVKIDIDGIIVKTTSGQRKTFSEVSGVFSNPSDPQKDIIYVYAPLDALVSRCQRQEFIQSKHEKIFDAIKEELI